MTRRIATGIDIGTREIKVLVCERNASENGAPIVLGSGAAESRGLRYGYIVNEEETTKALENAARAAEKSSGVKIKRAYLGVGGVGLESSYSSGAEIISQASSEITEADVERSIAAAENALRQSGALLNRRIIHRIPISHKIDGKEALGRPAGMYGAKLETKALFVTSMEQHLSDLVLAVENADIAVENIYAAPIAAGIAILSKTQKVAGCVLANIGAETVSLVVYENNLPISIKVFPIGAADITNDIALGLQIPLEEAEAVKVGGVIGSPFPKKKLDEIIAARLSDIFELIENHLKKIDKNRLLPAGIVMTGGGSSISTIEDLARAALRLPSKTGGNMKTSGNFKGNIKDSTWAVAYGLCAAGLGEENGEELKFNRFRENGRTIAEWFRQFLP